MFYYNSTEGKAFQYVNGEWKAMGGASGVVYTITPTAEQTDDVVAINAVVTDPEVGDIAIVKRQIAGDKYTHSTYIYDKTNGWIAADGSYNAQNVYFGEDLLTTTAIGNISLKDGQATIPVTGSNLIEAFNTIYVKETNTGLKTHHPKQINRAESGAPPDRNYAGKLHSNESLFSWKKRRKQTHPSLSSFFPPKGFPPFLQIFCIKSEN